MDQPAAPQLSRPTPSRGLPTGFLLVLGIIDLGWAALGLLSNGICALLVIVLAVIASSDEVPREWGPFVTWMSLMGLPALLFLLLSAALNTTLLLGALRLLLRRPDARLWIRAWAAGALLLGALDLAVIAGSWITPWSVIPAVLAFVTPAWAVVNWIAMGQSAVRALLVPGPRAGPGAGRSEFPAGGLP